MTLMIQPAGNRFTFQIPPNTRSACSENYHQVKEVLTGKREDRTVSVRRELGRLYISKGCHSLHWASLRGLSATHMDIFDYKFSPGVGGDPKVKTTIYGPLTLEN